MAGALLDMDMAMALGLVVLVVSRADRNVMVGPIECLVMGSIPDLPIRSTRQELICHNNIRVLVLVLGKLITKGAIIRVGRVFPS